MKNRFLVLSFIASFLAVSCSNEELKSDIKNESEFNLNIREGSSSLLSDNPTFIQLVLEMEGFSKSINEAINENNLDYNIN
ncbi:hypothetical protein BFP78_00790 [Gaetbulibacter sp. 5U11]|nr:hypothetical protein BFP78_00790 [Gaetbulibacter sp. 5U11]